MPALRGFQSFQMFQSLKINTRQEEHEGQGLLKIRNPQFYFVNSVSFVVDFLFFALFAIKFSEKGRL